MTELLGVVITFVSVMLVLALAAQALLEALKAAAGLKGGARQIALQNLLRESANAAGIGEAGADLVKQIEDRLKRLGQKGLRGSAVRLDWLTGGGLNQLITKVPPDQVKKLEGVSTAIATETLARIGKQAEEWFDLAMEPSEERYRRRMRGWGLATSLLVVIAFNANAFDIIQRASDPKYQTSVAAARDSMVSTEARQRADSTLNPSAGHEPGKSVRDSSDAATASRLAGEQLALAGTIFGVSRERQWVSGQWWVGVMVSTLLVSMGAPFWHDLLESLFGFKKRVQAEAKEATQQAKAAAT